jgi:hypothetical protein
MCLFLASFTAVANPIPELQPVMTMFDIRFYLKCPDNLAMA